MTDLKGPLYIISLLIFVDCVNVYEASLQIENRQKLMKELEFLTFSA
jgi:hypothetical protein